MAKRRRSTIGFLLSESFYGVALGLIALAVSFLVSEFGVWVFTQWLFTRDMLLYIFYILNITISGIMLFIPFYNKRVIQGISAIAFLLITWGLLFKFFNFHPVDTLLSLI